MTESFAKLDTPLGSDADAMTGLHFRTLTGHDAVSAPFAFEIAAVSSQNDIAANDLLGQDVTLTLTSADDDIRVFHGLVDRFRYIGDDSDGDPQDRYHIYNLTVRPRLWLLSKRTDNRIFQDMAADRIVDAVLAQHGVSDYEWRVNRRLPERGYCVQYGETDLDFVQRLLEHEGVFYYFAFTDAGHTLILTDNMADLKTADGAAKLKFLPDATSIYTHDAITTFTRTDSIVPLSHSLDDYDFTKPSANLSAYTEASPDHDADRAERYSYPGNYADYARGADLAELRNESDRAMAQSITANSTAATPASGNVFDLVDHPRASENRKLVILRSEYTIRDVQFDTGGAENDHKRFEATYILVPASMPWRPAIATPKPVMKGPQTAIVTGPGGEEIHTDAYSRVKVQFHWDRLGGADENSSCWVRVSSAWAGSGWGFIQIPRIGQEVIVDFLEGDPDQPIVTGRVYNAEQMPPYGLPGNATQSGWKSESSKGGGGWNELRFEDLKGAEEVYFQAEKNHTELVKNNESRNIGHDFLEDVGNDATQNIGHDRTETVTNDKSVTVGVDRNVAIGNNDTETVGTDRSLSVGNNETITIGTNSSETIGMNHSQSVGLTQSILVGGARSDNVGLAESRVIGATQTLTVGLKRSVQVGSTQTRHVQSDDSFNIGGKQTTRIGKEHSLTVGARQDFTVGGPQTFRVSDDMFHHTEKDGTFKADKNVLIEAGDQIVLKCGAASITMKKDGTITIAGKDIGIDGSGKIDIVAGGELTQKGSKINQN